MQMMHVFKKIILICVIFASYILKPTDAVPAPAPPSHSFTATGYHPPPPPPPLPPVPSEYLEYRRSIVSKSDESHDASKSELKDELWSFGIQRSSVGSMS